MTELVILYLLVSDALSDPAVFWAMVGALERLVRELSPAAQFAAVRLRQDSTLCIV